MATTCTCRCFSWFSLVVLVLRSVTIESSNLEIRLPMVKEGPLDSNFGLSLAEHRVMKSPALASNGYEGSLVLVGAPTYDDPTGAVPKTGAIFKCPLSTFVDDCEDLKLDAQEDVGDGVWNNTDQWLGVSVRSQGPGGKVAACAHRSKKVSEEEISGLGKCFLMNEDLTENDYRTGPWKMCDFGIGAQLGKKKYGFCQAGTGFYMTKADDGDFGGVYIAGTPGAGDWRGGVFVYNIADDDNPFPAEIFTKLDDESTGVGLNSYLGFSVTSGKFGPSLLIAAGAPRHNAIGAVIMIVQDGGNLHMQTMLRGEQLAESFGYEVCSADLDGDGFDDLLVGAPIYYDRNTAAGGRVYIYLNKNQNGNFTGIEPIRLTGSLDSMFGIAITNLGDLNLDGYEDVAIGAPYENNGEGAVYIYLGSPNGIVQPESQKITPSDFPNDLPTTRDITGGFGYALSGGIDLDGNQYPDLSIGSFEANAIVTLRARPIINVTAELVLENTKLDANSTNFMYNGKPTFRFYVKARMKYVCNAEEFDARVEVVYSIEAEQERRALGLTSRIIFEDTKSYGIRDKTMTLRPQSQETPKDSPRFWAILRPGFTDIFRPIPFKLTFKLKEVEVETPAPGDDVPDLNELPILNSLYDPHYIADLDFIKECAQDDGKCITDLDLEASLRLDSDPPILRVGEHNDLFVDVVLRNREEPAYDAKLTITFPEILGFSKIEDDASQYIRFRCNLLDGNTTVLQCALGNPYPELQVERFTIKFDASDVPSDAGNFTIRMVATATNEDSHPDDNRVDLFAEVESITDIEILGDTNSDQYTFGGEVRGESTMNFTDEIGEEVIHMWSVLNLGPGIIPESVLTISFPYEVANGKWLLYMTHAPVVSNNRGRCEIDPIFINELNIKERPQEPGYDEVTTAAPGVGVVPPASEVPYQGSPSAAPTQGGRKRRDTGDNVVRPQKRSTAQDKHVRLDCWNGLARCIEIMCYIDRLDNEEQVDIIVRSRLWNSTFLEDYSNVQEVKVVSTGKVEILNAPFLTQLNLENDEANVTIEVIPDITTLPAPEPLAWWIILLAVLGGLIILIFLILLLWKVGFFRRPGRSSGGGGGGGSCGFFERKTMAYKYATVTQKTPGGNAATEKTAYYDEKYFT